jgi:hypothetical protein
LITDAEQEKVPAQRKTKTDNGKKAAQPESVTAVLRAQRYHQIRTRGVEKLRIGETKPRDDSYRQQRQCSL